MTTKRKKPTTKRTTISDAPDAEKLAQLAASPAGAGEAPAESPEKAGEETAKRGRPRGSKKAPPEPVVTDAMMRMMIALPYAVVAKTRGKHWELTDAELDMMVESHQKLASQYLPDWLKQHEALYSCAVAHVMMILGRLTLQADLDKLTREKREAEGDHIGGGRVGSPAVSGEARFGQVYTDDEGSPRVSPRPAV